MKASKQASEYTSTENQMEALAIVLESLIAMLTDEDRGTVRFCRNRFVFTGRIQAVNLLQESVSALIKELTDADCLRYSEEVAAYLILRKYTEHRTKLSYAELINAYSYAPEIRRFIQLTAAYIQKTNQEREG